MVANLFILFILIFFSVSLYFYRYIFLSIVSTTYYIFFSFKYAERIHHMQALRTRRAV